MPSANFWKIVNARIDRYNREAEHVKAGGKCHLRECTAAAVEVVEFFHARTSSLALCAAHAQVARRSSSSVIKVINELDLEPEKASPVNGGKP